MELNDLLRKQAIDPAKVLVFRHSPKETELRRVLPWLAQEQPEVFNAYQQTQGPTVQRAMERLSGDGHVASFIGHEPGKALFVGLYAIGTTKALTLDEYWRVPAYVEMSKFGMRGFTREDEEKRRTILWFDLQPQSFYPYWKGKLTIDWPGKELSWWRHADRNEMAVLSILEESALAPPMPEWDRINLTWEELDVLPASWRQALSQWRGIYLISDASDGKGYVGSAYGADNLYGRWKDYAMRGHGGNRHLRDRDPRNFRFCILQRVAPDLAPNEIVSIENSWKTRLNTECPHGLNGN